MIPIPAIDLKDGNVVRLLQGRFEEEKIYFGKPEAVAKRFEAEGARRIHVVDLDGALRGQLKNKSSVEAILKNVSTPLQVGGGIRDLKSIAVYFEMGVSWVILGTQVCLDKGFAREALAEYQEKILIGIDAVGGRVATDGWTKVTTLKAANFAKEMEALGAKTIIYTDISKDGVLKGPNLKEIKTLSQSLRIGVIASGGISSLDDLWEILDLKQKNIQGVIIGKALYENKFTLKDAVTTCSQNA